MPAYGHRQRIGLVAGPVLFLLMLSLPAPPDMEPAAWRVAAMGVLMATWWVTEALPLAATALLPIALLPLLAVTGGQQVTSSYGHPLIFLFVGGFFIAKAMEKANLHERIALHVIRRVGTNASRIVLGFMVATGFLSMWISNTATAMMMLPIGIAVVKQAADAVKSPSGDGGEPAVPFRFGTGLMLGIAYAASIGGIATIIGTPPNAVLVAMMDSLYGLRISFASWMAFGLPLSIVMMLAAWLYLVRFAFRPEIEELPGGRDLIRQHLAALGPMSPAERRVLVVFVLVALSWILRGFIDLEALALVTDTTIAIAGAIALFVIPADLRRGAFLLDWQHAVRIPWGVVILFGGGLALAGAFRETGLDQWIGARLAVLEGAPLLLIVVAVATVVIFLTEITSNTATATVFVPIMGGFAIAMGVHPFGPAIAAALAASCAFMLPVATPPNAVVYGSGHVAAAEMARAGVWLNLLGIVLITALVYAWLPLVWGVDLFSTLDTLPAAERR